MDDKTRKDKIKIPIITERLIITEFDLSMAESVHLNSLDEDNRTFQPDEVFETADSAREVIAVLMSFYESKNAPLVYPILLKNGQQIGHVQAVPINGGWEIGYHIGKAYTKNGFASEAVTAFLPIIMEHLDINQIYGICRSDNYASQKVLEKCGFIKEFERNVPHHGGEYFVFKKPDKGTQKLS